MAKTRYSKEELLALQPSDVALPASANAASTPWLEKKDERMDEAPNGHPTNEEGATLFPPTEQGNSEKTSNEASLSAIQVKQVIGQVEWYLSDKNLARPDRFLLGQMKGRKNKPIPIEIIHGFAKMQEYQPFEGVVEALKKSEKLKVLQNDDQKWCVKRNSPFVMEEVQEALKTGEAPKPKPKGAPAPPKPKQVKPTGFEDGWVDAPVDPETFQVEKDLYSDDRPLGERIQTAIKRYQGKRRFDSIRKDFFDKWMRFGGIDSMAYGTGGTGSDDVRRQTNEMPDDINAITATTYLSDEMFGEAPESKWEVDFEGIAKGYLSVVVPEIFDLNTSAKVAHCMAVMRNFYNYLLQHNVCPEFERNILAARSFCDAAQSELLATYRLQHLLPGSFNIACSTLFGGYYEDLYVDGQPSWEQGDSAPLQNLGMSKDKARTTFKLAMASYGDEIHFADDGMTSARKNILEQIVVKTEKLSMEIEKVSLAPTQVTEVYDKFDSAPLAKLCCKQWKPSSFDSWDLPKSYTQDESEKMYEFWVEEDILQWCEPGMKIQGTVKTLSNGMRYLDYISGVKCSFYTMLENELLRGYRPVKTITREEHLAKLRKGDHVNDDDL